MRAARACSRGRIYGRCGCGEGLNRDARAPALASACITASHMVKAPSMSELTACRALGIHCYTKVPVIIVTQMFGCSTHARLVPKNSMTTCIWRPASRSSVSQSNCRFCAYICVFSCKVCKGCCNCELPYVSAACGWVLLLSDAVGHASSRGGDSCHFVEAEGMAQVTSGR